MGKKGKDVMLDVNFDLKAFLVELKKLFPHQSTFLFWQNQQRQSFIELILQGDSSRLTHVSVDVLVVNNADKLINLEAAHLGIVRRGRHDSFYA
jgi:hypothetical protein